MEKQTKHGKSPCYSWVNQRTEWPCSSSQSVSQYQRVTYPCSALRQPRRIGGLAAAKCPADYPITMWGPKM